MAAVNDIAFEVHITVAALQASQLSEFVHVCKWLGAKPLLIELARGEMQQQPMLSKIVFAQSLPDALNLAQQLISHLESFGFTGVRQKLEIAANLSFLSKIELGVVYFEWHARLPYQDVPELLAVCEQYQAHLSRNALADTETHPTPKTRFVTLRRKQWQDFCAATIALRDQLCTRWPIQKETSEICVFDSNLQLDQGWLYASANQ